jgi:hypothetical protein
MPTLLVSYHSSGYTLAVAQSERHFLTRFILSPIRSLAAAVLLLSTSCASQTSAGSEASPATAESPNRAGKNQLVISQAELQDPAIAGQNANYAIQQLRPAFFRTRGSQTMRGGDPASAPGQVKISQDYGPLQAVTALTSIDTRTLIEIRYLDAVAAQARFGINANGGPVIVLLSTKQP